MTLPSENAAPATSSSARRALVWAAVVLLLAAAIWIFRSRIHFDPHALIANLRGLSLPLVLAGMALTYLGNWLRAWRWAIFLAPVKRVPARSLFASQLIGFSAVALFGRVADLSRPYLVARRTETSVATQLAIYSIERAFDLGAAAVLFSITLVFAPKSMPHHETFAHAGELALAATLAIALFAAALRISGETLARLTARMLRPFAPKLAETAAERLLDFREGMRAISTLREFLWAEAISLLMWAGYAGVYFVCVRAFRVEPTLAAFTLPATMLLMATSMGGSLLQLPVIGWFTQIAVLAAALRGFFGVPLETASACGAVLLFATNLSVVPGGLIAARVEGVALRDAAKHSEAIEEVTEDA